MQGIPEDGRRLGNWLTSELARELLTVPDRTRMKAKRDYAVLSVLAHCALRTTGLANSEMNRILQCEGHWGNVDVFGKRGRVRSIALPPSAKAAIGEWTVAESIR